MTSTPTPSATPTPAPTKTTTITPAKARISPRGWASMLALAAAVVPSADARAQLSACGLVGPGGGGTPVFSYTRAGTIISDRGNEWASHADARYTPNGFGVATSLSSSAWTDPAGGDLWTASTSAACLYPGAAHFVHRASSSHVGSFWREQIGAGGASHGVYRTTWRLSHPTLTGAFTLHARYRVHVTRSGSTAPILGVRSSLSAIGFNCSSVGAVTTGTYILPLTSATGWSGTWNVPFEVSVQAGFQQGSGYQQSASASAVWRLEVDRVLNAQGQVVTGWVIVDHPTNNAISACAGAVCVSDVDNGSGTGACDGGTGIEDLLYYLAQFEAGTLRADVDDGSSTGTPDGGVGIEDLLYYLQRYDAGC